MMNERIDKKILHITMIIPFYKGHQKNLTITLQTKRKKNNNIEEEPKKQLGLTRFFIKKSFNCYQTI